MRVRGRTETSGPAVAAKVTPPATANPKKDPKKDPKKEKKGLFKPSKSKEAPKPAAPPPPPVATQPATPPRPRFTAPYNYVAPGSAASSARPSYPTIASSTSSPRTWQPPASFNPPPSPSFSSWGPKASEPEPQPPVQLEDASPAALLGDPLVAPAEAPVESNADGRRAQEEPGDETSPWLFNLGSNLDAGGAGRPLEDPELPAFIELSMFQDPTSADDIAAEGEAEGLQEKDAQAAWLANEAWSSPIEIGVQPAADPWNTDEPGPVNRIIPTDERWFQDDAAAQQTPAEDWTSTDTPWPGETRRPSEPPSWGEEAAGRFPSPDPWAQQGQPARGQSPVAEPEPQTSARKRRFRKAADDWSEDAWRAEPPRRQPVPPPVSEEDAWASAGGWRGEEEAERMAPVQPPAAESPMELPEPAEEQVYAEPAADAPSRGHSNGHQAPQKEDSWKPLSIEMDLVDEDPEPAPIPVAAAAARLKAAETAIKVENGLAYVLVDDEGRPVLK